MGNRDRDIPCIILSVSLVPWVTETETYPVSFYLCRWGLGKQIQSLIILSVSLGPWETETEPASFYLHHWCLGKQRQSLHRFICVVGALGNGDRDRQCIILSVSLGPWETETEPASFYLCRWCLGNRDRDRPCIILSASLGHWETEIEPVSFYLCRWGLGKQRHTLYQFMCVVRALENNDRPCIVLSVS